MSLQDLIIFQRKCEELEVQNKKLREVLEGISNSTCGNCDDGYRAYTILKEIDETSK